MMTTNKN